METVPDYSGYDTNTWQNRTGDDHKEKARATLEAKTKKELQAMEAEDGVRYSELFRLPYYDPVRMHVVDPMHNLLLGIAKHVFSTWIESGSLTDDVLAKIDKRMERIKIPSDLGRIPNGISKNWKSFKADEWKHWTVIYSYYYLREVISCEESTFWCMFANACKILCKQCITSEENDQAYLLLLSFCNKFQELYGRESCVPNMHMSLHIINCIRDYGPTYAFWCFSFERYNGYMGKYQTNNHAITPQLMRKVIADKAALIDLPEELSLKNTDQDSCDIRELRKLWCLRYAKKVTGSDLEFTCERPLAVSHLSTLTAKEEEEVQNLFCQLYGSDLRISTFIKECKRLSVGNETVASQNITSNSYSIVLARYPSSSNVVTLRPAVITGLYELSIIRQEDVKIAHFVAKVKWLKENENKDFFGKNANLEIWSTDFDPHAHTFIPAKYIFNRVTLIKTDLNVTKSGRFPLIDRVYIMVKLPTKSIL